MPLRIRVHISLVLGCVVIELIYKTFFCYGCIWKQLGWDIEFAVGISSRMFFSLLWVWLPPFFFK